MKTYNIRHYNAGARPERKVRGKRPPKRIELAVRDELVTSLGYMAEDVKGVLPYLAGEASPKDAAAVLSQLQDKWRAIYGKNSPGFADRWVSSIQQRTKEETQTQLAKALGVGFTSIFDDRTVYAAAEAASVTAADLITRIPEEYFGDVREAVLLNYQQLDAGNGKSLAQLLAKRYDIALTHAQLIARDQTSKINTAITQARNEELGIEKYVWRTVGDSRVVGTPGGRYTKPNSVHGNHYERNGVTFYWSKPPEDGHPGWAINCRCFADPIIVVAELKNVEYGMAA